MGQIPASGNRWAFIGTNTAIRQTAQSSGSNTSSTMVGAPGLACKSVSRTSMATAIRISPWAANPDYSSSRIAAKSLYPKDEDHRTEPNLGFQGFFIWSWYPAGGGTLLNSFSRGLLPFLLVAGLSIA